MTKIKGFVSFNVACKWKRKILCAAPKEKWFILTNFDTLSGAITADKKRVGIEEMFRYFKKGGDNLEDTNVSGERLTVVILLIAMPTLLAPFKDNKLNAKQSKNILVVLNNLDVLKGDIAVFILVYLVKAGLISCNLAWN